MKNDYFFKSGIMLLLVCMVSFGTIAQVAVVGTLENGKPVVTSLSNATAVLKGGLSTTAAVADIYIDREPESGKYFLFGTIKNDPVTGKAVELKLDGVVLRAAGGPGLEITCHGYRCSQCIPKISNWKVRCVCEDLNPPADMRCDMDSKIIVTPW